jgi:transposase
VTFSINESASSELHLRIGFAPGSRFPDETIELCPVHDTVERQWQHLSFLSTPVISIVLHRALPLAMVSFEL